jgi:predicted ATPase
MTKNNFHVLSGGPGGGKTSLLQYLASIGYTYVPETAREMIRERLLEGLPPRPEPAEFAREMFFKDYNNYISNMKRSAPLFFDRSFIDSAGLLRDSDIKMYDQIRATHLLNRYNNKVFITPPWKEIYQNDPERDQAWEDAVDVYHRVCHWYKIHQYEIVMLPKESIEKRAAFILQQITK